MATVHHTEAVFEVAETAGIRATIGKAMMDTIRAQVKVLQKIEEDLHIFFPLAKTLRNVRCQAFCLESAS